MNVSNRFAFFFASCMLCAPSPVSAATPGDILLEADFTKNSALSDWNIGGDGEAQVVSNDGNRVLSVSLKEFGNHLAVYPVPLTQAKGNRLTLSAQVKSKEVAKPEQGHDGIKFMVQTRSPDGDRYHAVTDLHGSFDWRELGVTVPVPDDATEVNLYLGLANTSGTVIFDDVLLTISAVARTRPASRTQTPPPEQLDRRTDVTRMRGVMYGPRVNAEDLRVLAGWGANVIRWQFYWHGGGGNETQRRDLEDFDRWMTRTIADLEKLLPLCEELGLHVIIDFHTPPGGNTAGEWLMFSEAVFQQKFIDSWDLLVKHFKDEPMVWGYDLLNEPFEGRVAEGLMNWHTLAETVAKRIRAADPEKAIFVAPGPYGGWDNLPYFEPLNVEGIIYTVHMYEPLRFTHQGIFEGMNTGVTYPGEIEGVFWDKAQLRKVLDPVRRYQLDYNVPIFVGEFSAPRWAPGDSAATYLQDCIAVFEEFGWDWTYHSFREWHAWNVELGPDPALKTPVTEPTSRQKVLLNGFSGKPE